MKTILIPTDFSETATNAIKYALELFKYDKSEITIIHAFADEVYENAAEMSRDYFEEYKDKVQVNVDARLQKVIAEILTISPNPRHKYKRISRFGTLVDVINEYVEKENADVVVMGTKGQTDDASKTFGSNTIQVIKFVDCPVLSVPAAYHNMHPQHVLFPTDYMMPFKRRELKLVSNIAMNYVSTIHFLHVSKAKKLSHRQIDNKEFLECAFNDNKLNFFQIPESSITETINTTIKDKKVDLLVMVNHRHSYLEDLLYSSTIEKIELQIDIPFLVLQNLRRE